MSSASRPSAASALSTAPMRPAKVVKAGTPRAAASRFMVPPAEMTRSASRTRLGPSTGRSGTIDVLPDELFPLQIDTWQHDTLNL